MSYRLNTERMRVVQRNERGNVTYRKSYNFGDEVDTDRLEEGRLEALVEDGVLVSSEDDLSEAEDAGGIAPTSPPFGAATAASVPGTEGPEDDGTEQPDEGDEATGSDSTPSPNTQGGADPVDPAQQADNPDDPNTVDRYDEMDYAALKAEAKQRDVSQSGSAEDLRNRLRQA